jgi:hypothetical protein
MTGDAAHTPTERDPLIVQRLGIDRMDGIGAPFEVDPLGPGINVIHGPNAIGKSRTSAAIQALVWPDLADSYSEFSGELTVAGASWRVENRFARTTYQRNGSPITAPSLGIAPSNQRDRYLLTLHDLLHADDRQFAETIQRESAGGYDLNAARVAAGVATAAPRPNPGKSKRDYERARGMTTELKRNTRQLQMREQSRMELATALNDADAAIADVHLLEAALAHASSVSDRTTREIARDTFQDPIGRMSGDEFSRIVEHRGRIAELEQQLTVHKADIARHEQTLTGTGFAAELPSGPDLFRLSGHVTSLKQVDSDLDATSQANAACLARLVSARNRIAGGMTDAQLTALDGAGLGELGAITRRFRDARNSELAQAELAAWIGGVEAPANLDALRRGTELLAKRLSIAGGDATAASTILLKRTLMGAAAIVVVEAVVLAVVSNPAWLGLALIAIPLVWIALRSDRSAAIEEAARTEMEFTALGLGTPATWSPDQVEPFFAALHAQFATARLDDQKATRWGELANRRAEATRTRTGIELARDAQIASLGITVSSEDFEEIRLIAEAIDHWRKATDDLAGSEARLARLVDQRSSLLAGINQAFGEFGVAAVANQLDAEAHLGDLQRRVELARHTRIELSHSRQAIIDQVQPAIDREHGGIDAIFNDLGFQARDDTELREFCGRVPACKEAQVALDEARVVEYTRKHALAGAPDLVTASPAEIASALVTAQAKASERDSILERIARLDHDLAQARQQTALEEAIGQEALALDALRASRNQDDANAARWQVAEFVQRNTRDLNRPLVFHAARKLFSQFTAGAWRLELSDGHDSAFFAVETSTNRSCTLERLSSGTRVQLLMAVRIAFLEASEQGPQLPLILDETLGNADDVRANAIIDATIEIARRGRQIIYFTAQNDELGKWQSRIDQFPGAPPLRLIDLAVARGIGHASIPSTIVWERTVFERISLPEGTSHEAARAMLHVGQVDLWADHIDGVDLWYLIPDISVLTQLRQAGIVTWGQYRQLRQHGGLPVVAASEGVTARCEARLLVIDAVRRNWQRGRSRPLDRASLLASAAISPAFVNPMTELARLVDWSAGSLIRALRDRELPRFRQDGIQEMDDYFRANGYIAGTEPMPDGMIRLSIHAALKEVIATGIIDEGEIDRLLQNLGAAGATD